MPHVQGLHWMSRRDDENGCMVLFGGRIPSGLAGVTCEPLSAYRLELFETLDAMGAVGV